MRKNDHSPRLYPIIRPISSLCLMLYVGSYESQHELPFERSRVDARRLVGIRRTVRRKFSWTEAMCILHSFSSDATVEDEHRPPGSGDRSISAAWRLCGHPAVAPLLGRGEVGLEHGSRWSSGPARVGGTQRVRRSVLRGSRSHLARHGRPRGDPQGAQTPWSEIHTGTYGG